MKVKSDKLNVRLIKFPFKGIPLTRFIPNMTTLLGLCVGLTAVYHALHQNWERALWFVVIATVFDGMDGRLARLFNASSRFGAELDSLSDFVTFGVSPALVVYFHSLHSLGRLGWGVVLFFCICSGLRLARFNTMSIETDPGSTTNVPLNKYFIGVPMPLAGLLILTPLMVYIDTGYPLHPMVYAFWGALIGGLMISKIPTFAFKGVKIQPNQVLLLLGAMGIFAIGIMTRPWLTIPMAGIVYLTSFVLSYHYYKKELILQAPDSADTP